MICPECEGKMMIPDGPRRMVSCPLCMGRKEVDVEDAIRALFKFNRRMVGWYEKLVRTQELINTFIDRVRAGAKAEERDDVPGKPELAECDSGVGVERSE